MTDARGAGWHDRFPLLAIERHPRPLREPPRSPYGFPDAATAAESGPAAIGADFAPGTILAAYRAGYFPWPHPEAEELWFSPDPRAVFLPGSLYVSERLARRLRRGEFRFTMDGAFEQVLEGCADREEGTWITPRYCDGYLALHELGWAHSFEAWDGEGALVGGLYGIRVGQLFGAESMFHRATDASKAAMAAMMQWVDEEGIELVDVQVLTDHTERMGAVEIDRDDYLRRMRLATGRAALSGRGGVARLAR
jgi:leucyl/phenylalanyl-tRNA--protein transferase